MRDRKLWALFTLALVLRFVNLSSESLWLDEGLSVRLASMSLQDINSIGLQTDHNPPLYLYLLHFWINLFGNSEFAVRSLSAVLNVACVPVLWFLGKQMFSDRAVFIGTLIFALSPFQIYYAQETRAYSLLCFTSLTATLAFAYIHYGRPATRHILIFITLVLLLYSHIYGWFTLLLLNIWFFYDRSRLLSARTWILLQTAAFIAYLPYALILVELVMSAQQGYWIKQPGLIQLASTPVYFSGSMWAFIILGLGFCYGIYSYLNWEVKLWGIKVQIMYLSVWMAIPILVPFLLSQILSPFFLPRYAIAASPAWCMLMAFGIHYIPKEKNLQSFALAFMTFCMLSINVDHANATMREPWREALQDLKTASNQETIFVGSAFCIDEMFGYYWPDCNTAVGLERKTFSEDIRGGLDNVDENESAWFVSSHFEGHEDNALKQLNKRFKTQNFRDYFYKDLYNRKIRSIRIFKLQPRRLDSSNRQTNPIGQ
ncbi:MAG: glycosyltransferase family 39 protein [Calditrichia bacterium]